MTYFFCSNWKTSTVPADYLLSRGVTWGYCFFAVAFIAAYATLGRSILFDGNTLLTILLQLALIAAGAHYVRTAPARVILILYALILSVYAYPRLFQYLVAPETVWMAYGAGTSVGGIPITSQMVNHALLYQTGCFFLVLAGAFAASRMIRRKDSKEAVNLEKISKIGVAPLFVLLAFYTCIRSDAFQEIIWRFLGVGLSLYNFHSLVEILFNMDMLFFMVLALLYHRSDGFQRQFVLSLIITLGFLLFKLSAGSRGGGVLTLFYIAFILLASGTQKVPVAKILLYIISLVVISVATFTFATQVREVDLGTEQAYSQSNQRGDKGSINSHANVDTYIAVSRSGRGGIYAILNRIGAYIDASTITTNLTPIERLKNKFMTVEYAVKSAINIALPGVYFECCVINTSFVTPFIFGQMEEDGLYVPGFYESTFWTSHGFAHIAFDTPYDILFMLASGWLLGAAYLILKRTSYHIFVLPFFIMHGIYLFFIFQGLDAYLVDFQKFGLSACVAVLCIWLASATEDVSRVWVSAIFAKFNRKNP